MTTQGKVKTEHNGAKNGEGAWWGHRDEAKQVSKKLRRLNSRVEIENTLLDDGWDWDSWEVDDDAYSTFDDTGYYSILHGNSFYDRIEEDIYYHYPETEHDDYDYLFLDQEDDDF